MTTQILLAGFGGQGILFAGKVLAYCALIEGKHITWLPSYGPEMRGGTANCSVCISDEEVGSPIIQNPDILIAMNQPSFEKFIGTVKAGGLVLSDSSIFSCEVARTDIRHVEVDATDLADKNGLQGGANMVLLGRLVKESGIFPTETIEKALNKCVAPKRAKLIPLNMQAVELGKNTV
jgi:2-oxoglutarate ferredoxin oxidoreductase subunit gamma